MRSRPSVFLLSAALLSVTGCTQSHYRASADKQVYQIIREKQKSALGETNHFEVETRYSSRDPEKITPSDIIADRTTVASRFLSLPEVLDLAVQNNRTYQSRKEQLFLAALTLTGARHDFRPLFAAESTATAERSSSGEWSGHLGSRVSASQLLKSGGSIGLSLANDVIHYYTGNPRHSAVSLISLNVLQPLLRGAGAQVVAENLKQSERNVIYEVRSFAFYQNTFAVEIVTTYFRLLQQKDTLRNEFNNYRNLVLARERAEALSFDRLPRFQADQARQDELRAKSRYLQAVGRFKTSLDQFKNTLGIPIGTDLALDDSALVELDQIGLSEIKAGETAGFRLAVERRLDLLNEIDRFEDSKRKIEVAANQLKTRLDLFANASLGSQGPVDYTRFNFDDIRADGGLQLSLPLDRLSERNTYRASLINFERQIRSLAQTLDETRNKIRQDLRTLKETRADYDIQRMAAELADRRVESATLLLQAGRAQIRDLLEAQAAQLQARNAVTQSMVDFHVARLGLLIDFGLLKTDAGKFWLQEQTIPDEGSFEPDPPGDDVASPEKLFGK